MRTRTVIINTIGQSPGRFPPSSLAWSGRFQGFAQLVTIDAALGNDPIVKQDHGNSPVVELEKARVGIDVGQLRLDTEVSEEA